MVQCRAGNETGRAAHPVEQAPMTVAEIVADDPHAPRWHFLAPERTAVPFDPNGAIWWMGRYHLFYIFQDPDLPRGGHRWGHASSADLVHWKYHSTALAPARSLRTIPRRSHPLRCPMASP